MSLVSRGLQIRQTLRNASRMRTIVSVFAKHGFAELAERLGLGKFILERWLPDENAHRSVPERIRISFEELGPTFVKLGQLLASRPDLVPEEWSNEFARLHDRVQPLPFSEVDRVLREELGDDYRSVFQSIEESPLGSASIAQVHSAVLLDGRRVVLKVQRPGIASKIKDDVNVLFFLAELIETYIPESKAFRPQDIVQEFFEALSIETNFIAEANNIRRFQENFRDEPKIKIPAVEMSLVTERVLCMERLDGIPLSSERALEQVGVDRQDILKTGLRTYLKMVFMDGLFHGDLHAGNFLIYADNRIGLIDFGQVGRLNSKTQSSIANMMLALSREDYERLAAEYLDLAPYSESADSDALARDLRNLVAPYFGLTLQKVKLGQILMSSAGIAGAHQVSVPAELMLFFKSLIGVEGLGRRIDPEFDILTHALEFAGELVRHQYDPAKLTYELAQLTKDSKSLIASLPRQIHHWIRKVNSPGYANRIRIEHAEEFRRTVETSVHLLFLGLVIAALLLSSSVLAVFPATQLILGMPALSVIGYFVALGLGIVAFFNYIRRP